jgi:6,7-dimethyl-8-ribityllumazine synthase
VVSTPKVVGTSYWGYFYQEIGDKLLIGAQQTLSKYGIDEKNVDIFYAPGAV